MNEAPDIELEVVAEIADEVGPHLAVHAGGERWAMAEARHVLLLEGARVIEVVPVIEVHDLAFTPDGDHLLAAPEIISWALRTTMPLPIEATALALGCERLVAAAFDELGERLLVSLARVPDGDSDAAPVAPRTRVAWLDARSRALIAKLAEIEAQHAAVAVGPSGSGPLAAASVDILRFETPDAEGASGVTRLAYHAAPVTRLAFDRAGHLASGDANGCVAIWSPRGASPLTAWQAHAGAVQGLAWHPRGLLVTGGREGELCVWDEGELVAHRTFDGPIAGLALDPTGEWLALAIDAVPIPRLLLCRANLGAAR